MVAKEIAEESVFYKNVSWMTGFLQVKPQVKIIPQKEIQKGQILNYNVLINKLLDKILLL